MRILHVITSLQTGGAETMVVNLLSRLRSRGYAVGLIVFNGEHTALMDRLKKECPSCSIYRLGKSYYNPLHIVKLTAIMRKYDIVHTHNSSPQLFAAVANIACRRRLVTTEHSTNNRKRERGGVYRSIDKWMYNRYDRIVCISKVAENKLRQYLNCGKKGKRASERNKICTINNGVDVDFYHSARPLADGKSERFVVTMVAGFREAKDQDTLIRAISLLPNEDFELWLVGDGDRRNILMQLAEALNIQNRVRFWGLRSDVANILKSSDCVVMSSHWEGLSLSNIEGMSAGKPFVASDVDGLHEVTDGFGVLFPHGDADALATIIKRLHDDKSYYKEVANACYQRAKQFDIKTMVAEYAAVYDNLNNG